MRIVIEKSLCAFALTMALQAGWCDQAWSMTLKEAVSIAVTSSPTIGRAIADRDAIEFELRQARALYLPRLDLEGDIGAEVANNATSRQNHDQNHDFFRRQGSLVMRQLLFDGFKTGAEVENQASRVDSASFRVAERSQFIALAVVRQYLQILMLRRNLDYARKNFAYHERLLGRIKQGTVGGSLSIADRQQAQERLFAARSQRTAIRTDLGDAEATFIKLVGQAAGTVRPPASLASHLPRTLDAMLGYARRDHPTIKIARADIDAALALVKKAEADIYPHLALEARGTLGQDIGGVPGRANDARVGVTLSWNIYNGGLKRAHVQEQVRRVDEARMKLDEVSRDVDEAVRMSWNRRVQERIRLSELLKQLAAQNQVVASYTDQFNIGQRSLLDLLDAQNNRFSEQLAVESARLASEFADYRIFAATGTLLKLLAIKEPPAAVAYAREQAGVPPTPPAETMPRYSPTRDGTLGPLY